MVLTTKQELGLQEAIKRYDLNERYVTVSGYAGTGKSTLVRFIIEALDVEPNKVAYATFTGKAAEVLRKKGNPNAMTLHRLLYDNIPRAGGGFIHRPKPALNYTIIVVDEVSMVPKSMIDMLLKHKVFIIFLGDPFQLPQINKDETHDLLEHPHVFLDEIMRQEAESEIIQLTMKIRKGEAIPRLYHGNEVMILPKTDFSTGQLLWADQVICGTNATKNSVNQQMRDLLGYRGLPKHGEKMICLQNYWNDIGGLGSPLVNGLTGTIENPFESYRMLPKYFKLSKYKLENITCNFITDDDEQFDGVEMDKHFITSGGKPCLEWRDEFTLSKMAHKIGDPIPRKFDYGYCITCHKAQGSEWDKVLVLEERFPFDKIEHARWLYTAATRAAEKLVLVR